jgi:iron complex outermembrane receptor protein
MQVDSFGNLGVEMDAQLPLAGKTLGLATGFGVYDNHYANGGSAEGINAGGVLRWRPSPKIELLTFANHQQFWDDTSGSIYISNGNYLPPEPRRELDTSPRWTRNEHHADTFGTVGHASLGDWTLRAGLFRSAYSQDSGFTNLVFVNQDASTQRQVYASPASSSASWSGEFRLSRRFAEGPRQHLLSLSLRGRSIDSHYGGGEVRDLGMTGLDDVLDVPKPAFVFGSLIDDFTRQSTGGLSYSLKWKGIGEFTAGLQRTHYTKTVADPSLPSARRSTDANLPYLSAALTVIPRITLYGSYVRGLEDSGSAPGYATNANEVLEASRTSQYDFGLRWSPIKDTTVIVGYFRIAKPLIDIDQTGHYGVLGSQVHKGVEFSVTTNPTKSVRIVAGGVWLDPRIQASPLIAQPLGVRPVGQPQLRTRFNINWTPPFAKALTLDAYVNHDSGSYGTIDNQIYAKGSTRVGFGGRYRFKLGGHDFVAKLGLYNVANVFEFVPIGSGVYVYNTPRNVQGWITTEF